MKKCFLILFLFSVTKTQAQYEYDSLYNSKWKVGVKLSLAAAHRNGSENSAPQIILGIPYTRNIRHSLFNLESGIFAGLVSTLAAIYFIEPGEYKINRENYLELPVKLKFDNNGMFVSAGFSNQYFYTRFTRTLPSGEQIASTFHSYLLDYLISIGFEKYLGNQKEIFVELYFERPFFAASGIPNFEQSNFRFKILGLSLGFSIREN